MKIPKSFRGNKQARAWGEWRRISNEASDAGFLDLVRLHRPSPGANHVIVNKAINGLLDAILAEGQREQYERIAQAATEQAAADRFCKSLGSIKRRLMKPGRKEGQFGD